MILSARGHDVSVYMAYATNKIHGAPLQMLFSTRRVNLSQGLAQNPPDSWNVLVAKSSDRVERTPENVTQLNVAGGDRIQAVLLFQVSHLPGNGWG